MPREEYTGKGVLILDDLLATGGTLVGSTTVLRKALFEVVGAVTLYDVPNFREVAHDKLKTLDLNYKVVISNSEYYSDIKKLKYKLPKFTLENFNRPISRQYTISHTEWGSDWLPITNAEILFTSKDENLAQKIQKCMNISIPHSKANIISSLFSNGETRIEINTNVRNKHSIVICQIRTGCINDDTMELFMILDALNRANTDKITVVLPYYPYSRSDKKDSPRCPIGAALIANVFETLNVDNIVSVDLHAGQLQGLVKKGFHNLYIKKYMCEYIYHNYLCVYAKEKWNDHFIIISPDAGASKTIKAYSGILGINNIILDKQRDYSNPSTVVKSRFIGDKRDFEGKTGLIIDDIGDTMGTMCSASQELIDHGLKDVIIFLTHGVFSGPALERINNTHHIKEVVVTDSLPQNKNIHLSPKIRVLSIDELIARSLDGILTGKSISRLF